MSRGNHYAAQADPARNPHFRRQWTETPREGLRPVGEIAAKITNDIATRAVAHWLKQADQVEGEDRAVCLETADAIMRMAGLRWADFAPRKAA